MQCGGCRGEQGAERKEQRQTVFAVLDCTSPPRWRSRDPDRPRTLPPRVGAPVDCAAVGLDRRILSRSPFFKNLAASAFTGIVMNWSPSARTAGDSDRCR